MLCSVLQTPKTTQKYIKIHVHRYSRLSYTNGHPSPTITLRVFRTTSPRCTENDLLQKLLGPRSSASDMFVSSTSTNVPHVFKRFEHSEPLVASLARCNVFI